jgi:hypothetical protein
MTSPETGPDDEEAVRRLLAQAAGPVPVPADVRERLDQTLAELVAARGEERARPPADAAAVPVEPETGATVASLAAARRRRRWPALAAAAAAVLVAGYGLTVVVQNRAGDADSAATDSGGADTESRADAGDTGGSAAGAARKPAELPQEASGLLVAPDVTAAFRAEPGTAGAVVSPPRLDSWALGTLGVAAPSPSGRTQVVTVCATPPTAGDEQAYLVSFRGAVATMVLGPAIEGRRVAVVYGCRAARPLDATVLRAR